MHAFWVCNGRGMLWRNSRGRPLNAAAAFIQQRPFPYQEFFSDCGDVHTNFE